MKRDLLPILLSARRGEVHAQLHVGRCYLRGDDHFPCQPENGIRYLAAAASKGSREAAVELAEALTLDQLVKGGLLPSLRMAASEGCAPAQLKLGLWLYTDPDSRSEGANWLRLAAGKGLTEARVALAESLLAGPSVSANNEAIRLLRAEALAGNAAAFLPLAKATLAVGDLALFRDALARASRAARDLTEAQARMIIDALLLERASRIEPIKLPATHVRAALELGVRCGDADALLLLGRVLVGLDEALRTRGGIVPNGNRRRGTSYLMRAADLGQTEAMLALADVHGRNGTAAYNPRIGAYYLERAAAAGNRDARLRLGRRLLCRARCAADVERAVELLFPLAQQDEPTAKTLLASLVCVVAGPDDAAERALHQIATRNALLAGRLALARTFGLTRHEALTFDVARGRRDWGIVVDASGFFSQRRKRSPRVVPAVSTAALRELLHVTRAFEGIDPGPSGPEGDFRTRIYALRANLARAGADPSLFFSAATPADLDDLRSGRRWARRHADLLVDGGATRRTPYLETRAIPLPWSAARVSRTQPISPPM